MTERVGSNTTTIVDHIVAVRTKTRQDRESQNQVQEALPQLRRRVYGVVRGYASRPSIPKEFHGYKLTFLRGKTYLTKDERIESVVSDVSLAFEIPLKGEADPLTLRLRASSYPHHEEPVEGKGLITLEISIPELEGIYKIDTQGGHVFLGTEPYVWHGDEGAHATTRAITRPLTPTDIDDINQLLDIIPLASTVKKSDYYFSSHPSDW